MKNFVKGAFIFTGGISVGFIACGITAIRIAIKSDAVRDAVRNAVKKKVMSGVETILYGERPKTEPKVSYNCYKERIYIPETPVFESRSSAERKLNEMNEILEEHGFISVADMYELSGIQDISYMDEKYGWKDLKYARVARTRSGYILDLPHTVRLD